MTRMLERPVREEPEIMEAPEKAGAVAEVVEIEVPPRGRSWILRGAVAALAVGIGLGGAAFLALGPPAVEGPGPAAIAVQRADDYAEAMRARWLDVPSNVESIRYGEYADLLREEWLAVPANVEAARYAGYAEAMERAWLDVPSNVEAVRYAGYAEAMRARWLDVPSNVEALRFRQYAEWMSEHHEG